MVQAAALTPKLGRGVRSRSKSEACWPRPGDYVYVDTVGAAVILNGSLDRVLDEAAKIDAEDRESLEQISQEDPEEHLGNASER